MNPRSGDTVTSMKSTSLTTTTTKTTKTTTGARSGRPTIRAESKNTATRKRRQTDQSPTATPAARPEGTTEPPPIKSRRQNESAVGKSRLSGFLCNLTSRMRGPKNVDRMIKDENTEIQTVNLKNEVAPAKDKKLNGTIKLSKKRKIDTDQCIDKTNSAIAKLTEIEKFLADSSNLVKSDKCETNKTGKILSDSNGNKTEDKKLTSNVIKVNISKRESGDVVLSDITDELKRTKANEEKTNKCVEVYKNIVDSECGTTQIAKETLVKKDETTVNKPEKCKNLAENVKINSSCNVQENKDRPQSEITSNSLQISPRPSSSCRSPRRDESVRLRKTIQWLEDGARRMREDLATVRSELHEERRASKVAWREFEGAIRDAKNAEAAKYGSIISDLKTRLSQSSSNTQLDSLSNTSKTDLLKEENHRREMAALKKRLAEAELTVQKLKSSNLELNMSRKKSCEEENNRGAVTEVRKLESKLQTLQTANKALEEKLQIAEESARARSVELRIQHERHEAELSALQKALRSDTIKMIDEIQSKNRAIEKLEKLVVGSAEANRKRKAKEDETMRKDASLKKAYMVPVEPVQEEFYYREHGNVNIVEDADAQTGRMEYDQLSELAAEQREIIEVLQQAVKVKDRKLEQLANKRRKEEFYSQWRELEPLFEVEDEDEDPYGEGDSALSSAPSSLSPQPGFGGKAGGNGVTQEAYDNLLSELQEIRVKMYKTQNKLAHARTQSYELEKALMRETRGSQLSRRALTEKLRDAEDRETSLVSEISELREQNELLEFRVLELEESPNMRDTPDPADSGIVSPEPIQLYKDHQTGKHRDRAVATVIPYTSNYNQPILPSDPQKASLSLQESGIFEAEDVEDDDNNNDTLISSRSSSHQDVELQTQSTQTEAPAGELLQEVQRLQELRARIQERAATGKLPPPPPLPMSPASESGDQHLALVVEPLRQRIAELEERVRSQQSERREAKQREEELLDENYRLTEKLYCLEADIRELQAKLQEAAATAKKTTREFGTSTETTTTEGGAEDGPMSRSQKIYKAVVHGLVGDDQRLAVVDEIAADSPLKRAAACTSCQDLWRQYDAKLRDLSRTEVCLRQRISSLEQREGAFFETLRQADTTWAKLETEYEAKSKEMAERLGAQVELNRALFEHLTKLNGAQVAETKIVESSRVQQQQPMEVDEEEEEKKDLAPKELQSMATQTDVEEEKVAVPNCRCRESALAPAPSSPSAASLAAGAEELLASSTVSRTSIKMQAGPVGRDEMDTTVSSSNWSIDSAAIGKTTTAVVVVEPSTEVAIEAKEDEEGKSAACAAVASVVREHQQRLVEAKSISGGGGVVVVPTAEPAELLGVDQSSTDTKQIIYFRWR